MTRILILTAGILVLPIVIYTTTARITNRHA